MIKRNISQFSDKTKDDDFPTTQEISDIEVSTYSSSSDNDEELQSTDLYRPKSDYDLTQQFKQHKTPSNFAERVYLVTTEIADFDKIRSLPVVGNTWIGTSVLYNFDAASQRGEDVNDEKKETIEHIIIADISKNVIDLVTKISNLLRVYDNKEDFKTALYEVLRAEKVKYGSQSANYLILMQDILTNKSFLATDARYNFIRNIAKKGQIIPIQFDITNVEHLEKQLKPFLEKHNMHIDTWYLTNIPELLKTKNEQEKLEALFRFVKSLPEQAYIITAESANRRIFRFNYPQSMHRVVSTTFSI